MPIKVKGMTYRPVQLPELRDAVFFGQTKVFDDVRRSICPSLQSAVKAGFLAVLDETPLVLPMVEHGTLPPPQPLYQVAKQVVPPPQAPQPPGQAMDMDAMAAKVVGAVTANVVAAMAAAQQSAAPATVAPADNGTAQALTALSRKIDGLMVSGAGVSQQTTMDRATSVEDVFVPTIRVDDMSNHVQLATRNLGQGGQVNAALAALRNMKNKQT